LKPWSEFVTIGRVLKPQGRKGELSVLPLSDREDRFRTLRRAFVATSDGRPRELAIDDCWPHKGRFVVKLHGVDSIDAAEVFRGTDLRIAPEELPVLPAGSYYHHELLGLTAFDTQGAEVGAVADLWETGGGATVLVIRGARGETLLPLAEPFLREVDLAARRLVVAIPESVEVAH
jgi:16S rRNA processing protein RimM